MIIYDGPSLLDGEPIFVVAIPEWNKKTGLMLSTWILLRDCSPENAADDGRDRSICGGCRYRTDEKGVRRCYVRTHWEPRVAWEKYHDGEYAAPVAWDALVNPRALPVRLGSYGDPAAVPVDIWRRLTATCRLHTGYTHIWRTADPELRRLCMASVDTPEEREEARAAGWRTFHVGGEDEADIICPASREGGYRSHCDRCMLCMGTARGALRSIRIALHGPGRVV